MADMNSYIASYCSRTGMSFDEATSKMESLRNNFRHDDDLDSIWEYKANEELTFEDFSEMMDKGAGASLSDADVEFLFDLFNKDGEGGISGEELSIIVGNKGVVTDFKIWGVLNNGDEKTFKEIQENKYLSLSADQLKDDGISAALKEIYTADEISKLENGEAIERKTLTSDEIDNLVGSLTDADLEDYKAILTPESYEELITAYEAKKGENTSGTGDVSGTGGAEGSQGVEGAQGAQGPESSEQKTTGDKSVDDMRTTIANIIANDPSITPEDVISQLDPNVYDPKFIEQLRASYNVYENESAIDTQWEIQKLNNPDITRLEVIEIMKNNGTLGKLVKDSTMPLNETTTNGSSATLSDDRVKEYTTRLWELAPPDFESAPLWLKKDNYDNITNLLVNDKLSGADVVNIIANMTPDEPGNWLWMLQESGDREMSSKLLDQLLPKIAEEALAGNDKAIEILCNAIEMDTANSTEGLFNKNHLLLEKIFGIGGQDPVMKEQTDELLSLIKNEYPKYNNDAELIDHISGEWLLDNKDDYKDKLTFLD